MSGFQECEEFDGLRKLNCRGERLTAEKCDRWRHAHGLERRFTDSSVTLPPIADKKIPPAKPNPVEWNPSMPSRGLGDDIAKVMAATGMASVVKAVTKAAGVKDCGCAGRQKRLNEAFPRKDS